jgi:glycosyltransferase involved in cell wall biosynthesis
VRVTLVSKFLDARGGDTTSVRLLEGWLRARGHDVSLFGTRPDPSLRPDLPDADLLPPPLASGGSPLRRAASIYRPLAGRALAALMERRRPELIHLHNIHYHLGGAVIAAARARRVPILWTLHDVNLFCPNICGSRDGRPCLECHVARPHRCLKYNCRDSLLASAAATAEALLFRVLGLAGDVSRFIAPSGFTRLLLELEGVPAGRIAHLEPGLDLETFACAPAGGGGILYVGRLAREKGIDVLLRALAKLPRLRLSLAGEGPMRRDLERLAEQLAPGRVRFLGLVPRPELARVLALADALVLPSVCLEIAPLALLEAAAAARPVVASRVGGVPEWVEHGESGLLTPPGEPEPLAEALSTLQADPARARAMGERAREVARRRFEPSLYCDKLERLYEHAAAA